MRATPVLLSAENRIIIISSFSNNRHRRFSASGNLRTRMPVSPRWAVKLEDRATLVILSLSLSFLTRECTCSTLDNFARGEIIGQKRHRFLHFFPYLLHLYCLHLYFRGERERRANCQTRRRRLNIIRLATGERHRFFRVHGNKEEESVERKEFPLFGSIHLRDRGGGSCAGHVRSIDSWRR